MKTKPNDYASPISAELIELERMGHLSNTGQQSPFGMTKREQFAMAAMQGMMSSGKYPSRLINMIDISKMSVRQADLLIDALNKE